MSPSLKAIPVAQKVHLTTPFQVQRLTGLLRIPNQNGIQWYKVSWIFIHENLGLEDSIIIDIFYIIRHGSWETVLGKLKGYIDLGFILLLLFWLCRIFYYSVQAFSSGSVRVQSSQQGCPRVM